MNTLRRIVATFPRRRILVIGDLIFDVYHTGAPLKISAETPTVVARAQHQEVSWGGAGLVCRNVLELGGKVTFISVVGDDERARHARGFSHPDLTPVFVSEPGRTTTVKERFWVSGYKLLQWDHVDNRPVVRATDRAIRAAVRKHLPLADAVVVLDARHGMMTERLARALVAETRRARVPIYVDSQVSQREANHHWYRGAYAMCLNRREAADVDGKFDPARLRASASRLARLLRVKHLAMKLGEEGAAGWFGGTFLATPAHPVRVADTTGAGDAFLAAFALAGAEQPREALRLANLWAGLATTVLGAQPPSLRQFDQALKRSG